MTASLTRILLATGFVVLAVGAAPASGDHERCPGQRDDTRPQVVGTDDDDVLFVPEGGIGCGLGGNDVLRADRHGGTRLFGGPGDDVLCAQNNDADRLYGGDGEDKAKADEDDKLVDVEGDTVIIACHRA